MDHTRETSQLLDIDKSSLKEVSNTFGYDFNKPFETFKGNEKFTLNTIKKRLNGVDQKMVIVIIAGNFDPWGWQLLQTVKVNNSGFDIDVYSAYFETFNTIKDFEQARKNATLYYVVAQETQYLRKPKKLDYTNERVNVWDQLKLTIGSSVVKYKTRFKYINFGKGEKHFNYFKTEHFDKSGYDVETARKTLKDRVEKMKADRLANEVAKLDPSIDLIKLENELSKIKTYVLECIRRCPVDYNQIREKERKLMFYADLVYYYQKFKEKCDEKSFKSVKEYQDNFNYIYKGIMDFDE